ncbi:dehydrogenase [Streptomyces sp. NPDC096033]|uniref:dehydrogenase n=1 Tax=Streptomyces sp. NPDC096033 TaxID=3366071 RepID=UPI00382EF10E
MTSTTPLCPGCSRSTVFGGFVLSRRREDDKRVCRALWKCAGGHVWWHWADRPEEPLEECPMADLFR